MTIIYKVNCLCRLVLVALITSQTSSANKIYMICYLTESFISRFLDSCNSFIDEQKLITCASHLKVYIFQIFHFKGVLLLASSITWPKNLALSKFRIFLLLFFLKKTTTPSNTLLTQFAVLWNIFTVTSLTIQVLSILVFLSRAFTNFRKVGRERG